MIIINNNNILLIFFSTFIKKLTKLKILNNCKIFHIMI